MYVDEMDQNWWLSDSWDYVFLLVHIPDSPHINYSVGGLESNSKAVILNGLCIIYSTKFGFSDKVVMKENNLKNRKLSHGEFV